MSSSDAAPATPEPSDDDSYWGQLDDPSAEPADWEGDELEQAYLRAMEVLEASTAQLPELVSDPADIPDPQRTPAADVALPPIAAENHPDRIDSADLAAELNQLAHESNGAVKPVSEQSAAVTPRQILEALLFVGGDALTTKRLCHVLRNEFTPEFVESQIDELNALYTREGRPYEIRFGDGGYRMTLREDFERIRRKAYGLGPKEVRLTQEALEVLAVVAYHQPVNASMIEDLGKPGTGAVLRQLVRRELICVERSPERPRDVQYRTTPRFLALFGIRNLNELPRLEQISYK